MGRARQLSDNDLMPRRANPRSQSDAGLHGLTRYHRRVYLAPVTGRAARRG
jgi:hypothetical protein